MSTFLMAFRPGGYIRLAARGDACHFQQNKCFFLKKTVRLNNASY
jgi:hypothetical protein